jgi:predicted Zn-dependent protease
MDRCGEIAVRLNAGNSELKGPWRFHLLDSDKINAFSLPGGLIFITRGLYQRIGRDNDQLAAIIAHEMSHIISRDSLKPMPGSHEEALEREIKADRMGCHYLKHAHYDTAAMANLLAEIRDEQPVGWAEIRIGALTPKIVCSR